MLKFSYNTNGLRNMNLLKALNEIEKHGYDGAEISLHKMHMHPFNITDTELKKLKEELRSLSIAAANIATGCSDLLSDVPYEPSFISKDKDGRKKRLDLTVRTMEIAKYLNIPIVTFATGFKTEDVSDEEAYTYLKEGIAYCLKNQPDVILAIEPEPGMFIQKSTEAIKLINDIKDDRLTLNLDIGHVYCCEDDAMKAIEKSIPYSRHIHIEDIKNRIHYHEIPGTGDIDFNTIIKMLKELNYQHYVSVELYHHADVYEKALSQSLQHLRKVEQEVSDQSNT
ncbi:MAG TPA: sugar phosphate isomerase/epimerase family protein [Clostridia bacterium]